MNVPVIGICLVNLLVLALLPRLFFRSGQMNLAWCLTSLPFLVLSAVLLAGATGLVQPLPAGDAAAVVLDGLAALLAALAAGLLGMTVGVHRVPPALWHQADDAPAHIVTWGPYAIVRHPFYASYILNMMAAVCVLPHWATALALTAGVTGLVRAARREERRLLASPSGAAYRAYMERTGRFVPRFGALAARAGQTRRRGYAGGGRPESSARPARFGL